MDESMKYRIQNELDGSAHEALNIAVQSIYFNDSSDYRKALYDIVAALLDDTTPEYIGEEVIKDLVHFMNPDRD